MAVLPDYASDAATVDARDQRVLLPLGIYEPDVWSVNKSCCEWQA